MDGAVTFPSMRGNGRDRGFTLIEVAIATLILMIAATSVLGAIALGVGVNKAEGEIASRATTYAQSKLEELTQLDYSDAQTNTAVFPAVATGGTGLAAGGSITPGSPASGYVDYLAEDGARTTAARAIFTRQWVIADNASGNSKSITVAVYSRRIATYSQRPSTVVFGIRGNP